MILHFINRGTRDPAFAPIHLSAKLESVSSSSVRTDLVRDGESLWTGSTYHGEMKGNKESYPIIDLSEFPWTFPEQVPFQHVRNGQVLDEMQKQLNEALAALPFQMGPVDADGVPWKDALFAADRVVQPRPTAYFRLFRADSTPEWITGLDGLRMSGSWKVFLPNPSPERALIERIIGFEDAVELVGRTREAMAGGVLPLEQRQGVIEERRRQLEEEIAHLTA